MSQKIADRASAAEARTQETRGFRQQVRVAARRKYTPEEKVNVAPADVLYSRREQIPQRRREVKAQTIQNRRHYNQTLRELIHP